MSTDEPVALTAEALAVLVDLAKLAKFIPLPIGRTGDRDCPYVLVLPESIEHIANENGVHEGDVIQLKYTSGWWRVTFSRYLPTNDHAYEIRDVL